MNKTGESFDVTIVERTENCGYHQKERSSETQGCFGRILLNNVEYGIKDFVVIRGTEQKEVGIIECIYLNKEQFEAAVFSKYIFARKLRTVFQSCRLKFHETNEIVQANTNSHTVELSNFLKKCSIRILMADEDPTSAQCDSSTYLCRFSLLSGQLVPLVDTGSTVLSELSPNLPTRKLNEIQDSTPSSVNKPQNFSEPEECDRKAVTPSRRNSVKRNLSSSFADVGNYSIVVSSDEENNLRMKLRKSRSTMTYTGADTPRLRKSTRIKSRKSYVEFDSPKKTRREEADDEDYARLTPRRLTRQKRPISNEILVVSSEDDIGVKKVSPSKKIHVIVDSGDETVPSSQERTTNALGTPSKRENGKKEQISTPDINMRHETTISRDREQNEDTRSPSNDLNSPSLKIRLDNLRLDEDDEISAAETREDAESVIIISGSESVCSVPSTKTSRRPSINVRTLRNRRRSPIVWGNQSISTRAQTRSAKKVVQNGASNRATSPIRKETVPEVEISKNVRGSVVNGTLGRKGESSDSEFLCSDGQSSDSDQSSDSEPEQQRGRNVSKQTPRRGTPGRKTPKECVSSDSDSESERGRRRKVSKQAPRRDTLGRKKPKELVSSDSDSEPERRRGKNISKRTPKTPNRAKLIREGVITPSMKSRSKVLKNKGTPLMKARSQLHVSYVPMSLPCREKEYKDVYNFVEGKLMDGCGGCMYISGVPGTGKTATVASVIKSLQKNKSLPDFTFINVNAMRLTTPRQAYVEILKQLKGKTFHWEQAQTMLEEIFLKSNKIKPVVMLIDELDILCTKRQDVVYNLLDWPTKAKNPLIVITIANTMDLPERLLMSRVTSRLGLTRLTFQAYTHKQLQEIVMKRLAGIDSFNPDAVQFVARKVASVSGDARRALDICRRAAELAEAERGSQLVNMAHVNEALDAMITQPKVQAIKRSSKLEQLVLQAIVAEVERTGVEETTFSDVYKMLVSVAAIDGFRMVSVTIALATVSRLGSCRLILTDPKCNDIHQRIVLNVSGDDVYYALKQQE